MTELCQAHDCVRTAAGIIEKMDFSQDPCQDFYSFSCGNFVKTKVPPLDHSSRNILQEIQDELYIEMKSMLESTKSVTSEAAEKAKIFYTSCMTDNIPRLEDEEEEVERDSSQLLVNLIESSGGSWCALRLLMTKDKNASCHDGSGFDFDKRLSESIMNQIPSFVNVYVASPENETSSPYAFHVRLCLSIKSLTLSLSMFPSLFVLLCCCCCHHCMSRVLFRQAFHFDQRK